MENTCEEMLCVTVAGAGRQRRGGGNVRALGPGGRLPGSGPCVLLHMLLNRPCLSSLSVKGE